MSVNPPTGSTVSSSAATPPPAVGSAQSTLDYIRAMLNTPTNPIPGGPPSRPIQPTAVHSATSYTEYNAQVVGAEMQRKMQATMAGVPYRPTIFAAPAHVAENGRLAVGPQRHVTSLDKAPKLRKVVATGTIRFRDPDEDIGAVNRALRRKNMDGKSAAAALMDLQNIRGNRTRGSAPIIAVNLPDLVKAVQGTNQAAQQLVQNAPAAPPGAGPGAGAAGVVAAAPAVAVTAQDIAREMQLQTADIVQQVRALLGAQTAAVQQLGADLRTGLAANDKGLQLIHKSTTAAVSHSVQARDASRQARDASLQVQNSIATMDANIQAAAAAIQALDGQIQALTRLSTRIETQIAALQTAGANPQAIAQQQQALSSVQAQLSTVQAAKDNLENDLRSARADLQTARTDIATLEGRVQRRDAKIATLTQEKQDLEKAKTLLESTLQANQIAANTLMIQLRDEADNVQKLTSQIAALKGTAQQDLDQLKDLREELDRSEREVTRLRGDVDESRKIALDCETAQEEQRQLAVQLTTHLAMRDKSLQDAKQEITRLQGLLNSGAQAGVPVDDLRRQLAQATAAEAKLQGDITQMQAEHTAKVEELNRKVRDLTTKLTALQTRATDLESKQQETERALREQSHLTTEARRQLADATQQATASQAQIAQLRSDLEAAKELAERKERELQEYMERAETSLREMTQLLTQAQQETGSVHIPQAIRVHLIAAAQSALELMRSLTMEEPVAQEIMEKFWPRDRESIYNFLQMDSIDPSQTDEQLLDKCNLYVILYQALVPMLETRIKSRQLGLAQITQTLDMLGDTSDLSGLSIVSRLNHLHQVVESVLNTQNMTREAVTKEFEAAQSKIESLEEEMRDLRATPDGNDTRIESLERLLKEAYDRLDLLTEQQKLLTPRRGVPQMGSLSQLATPSKLATPAPAASVRLSLPPSPAAPAPAAAAAAAAAATPLRLPPLATPLARQAAQFVAAAAQAAAASTTAQAAAAPAAAAAAAAPAPAPAAPEATAPEATATTALTTMPSPALASADAAPEPAQALAPASSTRKGMSFQEVLDELPAFLAERIKAKPAASQTYDLNADQAAIFDWVKDRMQAEGRRKPGLADDKRITIMRKAHDIITGYDALNRTVITRSQSAANVTLRDIVNLRSGAIRKVDQLMSQLRSAAPKQQAAQGGQGIAAPSFSSTPSAAPPQQSAPPTVQGGTGRAATAADVTGPQAPGHTSAEEIYETVQKGTEALVQENQDLFKDPEASEFLANSLPFEKEEERKRFLEDIRKDPVTPIKGIAQQRNTYRFTYSPLEPGTPFNERQARQMKLLDGIIQMIARDAKERNQPVADDLPPAYDTVFAGVSRVPRAFLVS